MLDNFQNNVVNFKVEFHNFGKCLGNIVKMTIFRKMEKFISKRVHRILSFNNNFIIFFTLLPMLRGICFKRS